MQTKHFLWDIYFIAKNVKDKLMRYKLRIINARVKFDHRGHFRNDPKAFRSRDNNKVLNIGRS